jgi:Fe-S-cluster containining protein
MSERVLASSDAAEIVEQTNQAAAAVLAQFSAGIFPAVDLAHQLLRCTLAEGERWEKTALGHGPRLACREGCPWCCYGTKVDALAPEALVIAAHLATTGAAPSHIRRIARRIELMSREDRHRERVPCPLLDEERRACSIHALRPIACRGHGSLRARDCETALVHFAEDRAIPKHVPLLLVHSALSAGLRMALTQAGLDARTLELATALDVALSHRQSAERWARGEKIFGQAVATGTAPPERATPTRNQRKAARRARRDET